MTEDREIHKALKLSEHLRTRGYDERAVAAMHPALRKHHAVSAGVPDISDEAWNHVGKMISVSQEVQAKHKEDPFGGL